MPKARRSKFNAIPTMVDGIKFSSKAEARRYAELKLLLKAGQISRLILQPVYRLDVHPVGRDPVQIAKYVGDFQYEENGQKIVEEVKGFATPLYKLKKRFVEALYGIRIREIK